jgi:hypothetical protein
MWKSLLLAVALISMANSVSAEEQPQCNERKNVLDLLASKYKESPIALGVTNSGGLVEVLSNTKGGTWTIIVTTPQGVSCLVAAGEGWRNMQAASLDPEA